MKNKRRDIHNMGGMALIPNPIVTIDAPSKSSATEGWSGTVGSHCDEEFMPSGFSV